MKPLHEMFRTRALIAGFVWQIWIFFTHDQVHGCHVAHKLILFVVQPPSVSFGLRLHIFFSLAVLRPLQSHWIRLICERPLSGRLPLWPFPNFLQLIADQHIRPRILFEYNVDWTLPDLLSRLGLHQVSSLLHGLGDNSIAAILVSRLVPWSSRRRHWFVSFLVDTKTIQLHRFLLLVHHALNLRMVAIVVELHRLQPGRAMAAVGSQLHHHDGLAAGVRMRRDHRLLLDEWRFLPTEDIIAIESLNLFRQLLFWFLEFLVMTWKTVVNVATSLLVKWFNLCLTLLLYFLVAKLKNSSSKSHSHFNKGLNGEVRVPKRTRCRATEWAFQSVRILNSELSPNHCSSSWLFTFMQSKHAIMITEVLAVFMIQPWKYFFFGGQIL